MKRHLEPNKPVAQTVPMCWQREAPSACLRIEVTGTEAHLFPYQQLITASLLHVEGVDTLTLSFATHEVVLTGRNLRELLHALQDFAVKWVRPIPQRYHSVNATENGVISAIRITPAS